MSVNDNMPNAVWLWDASTSELTAVLLMADPVKAAKWAPTGCTLAICTGAPLCNGLKLPLMTVQYMQPLAAPRMRLALTHCF